MFCMIQLSYILNHCCVLGFLVVVFNDDCVVSKWWIIIILVVHYTVWEWRVWQVKAYPRLKPNLLVIVNYRCNDREWRQFIPRHEAIMVVCLSLSYCFASTPLFFLCLWRFSFELDTQGIDMKVGGKSKKTKRTTPKSNDIYLKLLVKVSFNYLFSFFFFVVGDDKCDPSSLWDLTRENIFSTFFLRHFVS